MDNATFSFRLWLRRLSLGLFFCALSLCLVPTISAQEMGRPEILAAEHAVSLPLRELPTLTEVPGFRAKLVHLIPQAATTQPDGALQTETTPAVATTAGLNFAGVGNGDYGFTPNAAPPDTNGAVGATQYVQWVNESFAVFDKSTGSLIKGPVAGNQLFQALGSSHPCAVNNDGDPIAQYDKQAGRWVLTQFSVTGGPPFFQCVAVSTTSDATGSYHVYAFQQPNFNDYPKLGVWPDAYYVTFNIFTNTFQGARVCAFDRAAMLSGAAATQVCFQLSSSFASLLPADLDGASGATGSTSAPPAGTPNFLVNFGSNSLRLWRFHVDFATPGNSTLTGPTTIPVAAFAAACRGGGACIPQSSTSQKLDSLADRLMYRLAYRNFGTHDALVVNHSVTVGKGKTSRAGIRWYELRSSTPGSGNFSVFQQGTFAPDSTFRWMGSIAMDKVGDIAVGYSASSSSVFPSIRYSGRVSSDALGTLESENVLQAGGGSQLTNLSRWGDYSSITIDPSDDCTLFYTTEYLKASGTFNWSTRIGSFKFPGCN
ncbi:MAG: hypothetical protein DMG67_03235 [Acidobacteria bacterium]|nr:MAG: hypothetical protein DMG67_03235 [Acidobacteriota bacterium]